MGLLDTDAGHCHTTVKYLSPSRASLLSAECLLQQQLHSNLMGIVEQIRTIKGSTTQSLNIDVEQAGGHCLVGQCLPSVHKAMGWCDLKYGTR